MLINFHDNEHVMQIAPPKQTLALMNLSAKSQIVHEMFYRIKKDHYDKILKNNGIQDFTVVLSGIEKFIQIVFVNEQDERIVKFTFKQDDKSMVFLKDTVVMSTSLVTPSPTDFPEKLNPLAWGFYKKIGEKYYCVLNLLNKSNEIFYAVWFFSIRMDNNFVWSEYDMENLKRSDLSSVFIMGLN